jgi:hypothetical protein
MAQKEWSHTWCEDCVYRAGYGWVQGASQENSLTPGVRTVTRVWEGCPPALSVRSIATTRNGVEQGVYRVGSGMKRGYIYRVGSSIWPKKNGLTPGVRTACIGAGHRRVQGVLQRKQPHTWCEDCEARVGGLLACVVDAIHSIDSQRRRAGCIQGGLRNEGGRGQASCGPRKVPSACRLLAPGRSRTPMWNSHRGASLGRVRLCL